MRLLLILAQKMEDAPISLLTVFDDLPDPRRRECPHRLDEFVARGDLRGDQRRGELDLGGSMEPDEARLAAALSTVCPWHCFARHLWPCLLAACRQPVRALLYALDWWPVSLAGGGQHVAIDGKCLRGSHDGARSPIHLVSAWSSTVALTLGQVRTADKSNEITAIPELLQALDIRGSTITIDAMGCQHDIAEQIVRRGADYVLNVKGNQPNLAEAIQTWFDAADAGTLERPFW